MNLEKIETEKIIDYLENNGFYVYEYNVESDLTDKESEIEDLRNDLESSEAQVEDLESEMDIDNIKEYICRFINENSRLKESHKSITDEELIKRVKDFL
jgi:hypothetical protein